MASTLTKARPRTQAGRRDNTARSIRTELKRALRKRESAFAAHVLRPNSRRAQARYNAAQARVVELRRALRKFVQDHPAPVRSMSLADYVAEQAVRYHNLQGAAAALVADELETLAAEIRYLGASSAAELHDRREIMFGSPDEVE